MTLKAIQPHDVKPSKVKLMASGEAGVGKTWWALSWPRPYLIDTEGGAVRKQYQDKLKSVGGVYFGQEQGSDNFEDVINEVKTLATVQHDYKTLVIDSFSNLYLLEAAEAELKVGSDFGKDRKAANKPTRQLMRWINKLDMNVILICHSKPKWERKGNELYQNGNTFEGYTKMEYDLDLFLEIQPGHKTFLIKKSRIESLPQGDSMPLSFDKFAEIYGADVLNEKAKSADMATAAQISKINKLIDTLNIDQPQIDKWFKKVDVDDWNEMTSKQISGLTEVLHKKIMKAGMEESNGKKNS